MLLTEPKYKKNLFPEPERHSDTGEVLEGVTVEISKLPTNWTSKGSGRCKSHVDI